MKKLAILLIIIPLSVNAVGGWYSPAAPGDIDSRWFLGMQTSVNIEGAFGLKLGATYNQDFLKPSYDFNTGNNWVIPSKPIDILSKYQLFVDDSKVAWQIVGFGKPTTHGLCWNDKLLLEKAIKKKYKVKKDEDVLPHDDAFDGTVARNFAQGRVIEISCKVINTHIFDPDADNTRLTVIYRDDKILDKYKNKHINSWSI